MHKTSATKEMIQLIKQLFTEVKFWIFEHKNNCKSCLFNDVCEQIYNICCNKNIYKIYKYRCNTWILNKEKLNKLKEELICMYKNEPDPNLFWIWVYKTDELEKEIKKMEELNEQHNHKR